MSLNVEYFARCIATLELAFNQLQTLSADDDLYDIYRAACVKEFEIILGRVIK